MKNIIKYIFLLNGVKFLNYNNFELFIYIINLLNIIASYSLVINFVISLFKDFSLNKVFICFYYLMDIMILVNCNKLQLKKNISRYYTIILNEKYKFYTKILLLISFIISLSISIIYCCNYNYINLIILNDWPIELNKYLIFFLTFYSINLKINILIYFFIMLIKLINIQNNFIKLSKENNYELYNLANQYLEIRHSYNKIIASYNTIISSIIFCNFLPSLYIISEKFDSNLFDIINYTYFTYFGIFCIIYHYCLNILDDNIKYLKSLSDKNIYIKKNIIRKKNLYDIKANNVNLNKINSNELLFKNIIIDIENSESIDWLIYSSILHQPLRSFEIFGFQINNSKIIIKMVSISVFILIGKLLI